MSVTRLTAAPLKLLTDPRCGRYIVAARDIGRGETVLAEAGFSPDEIATLTQSGALRRPA